MNHQFSPSLTDDKKCLHCKRGLRDHSKIAQCEACPAIGSCELFTNFAKTSTMLLCEKCFEKEEIADAIAYQAPELQEARLHTHNEKVKLNELLEKSQSIDQSITLVTDLFNAHTVAFVELGKAIDSDDSIINKPFVKTETALDRIKHFQTVLFDYKQKVVDMENGIRSGQVYVNGLLNQLKEEERAKLQLQDLSYPVKAPKTVKPKSTGTPKAKKSSKIDMTEVNKWAARIGMPGQLVHMRMLSKNMTAEAAARTFAAENGIDVKEN